jgi:hypothetical protein
MGAPFGCRYPAGSSATGPAHVRAGLSRAGWIGGALGAGIGQVDHVSIGAGDTFG